LRRLRLGELSYNVVNTDGVMED